MLNIDQVPADLDLDLDLDVTMPIIELVRDIFIYYNVFQFHVPTSIIIVAFLENATIGYSLESLCVCVCVSVCVCVCFCTITQKEIDLGTRNRNTL